MKRMTSLARMGIAKYQLRRMGRGELPKGTVSPMWALIIQQILTWYQNKVYRRWLERRDIAEDT